MICAVILLALVKTFYCAMLCYASAVYAVVVCLAVCLSVTCRYCIKMAKLRITQTMPHQCQETLVLWSWSHDVFKCLEMSNNILQMVQERDTVTMDD